MFLELTPQKYRFNVGNAEFWLRYPCSALLEIEQMGLDFLKPPISADDAFIFLSAGLHDYFAFYDYADNKIITNKLLEAIPPEKLIETVNSAIVHAFPPPVIGSEPSDKPPDFSQLRTLYCDIMHRSENDFWDSTPREILERWNAYAIFKGYKKPPVTVKKYDDE